MFRSAKAGYPDQVITSVVDFAGNRDYEFPLYAYLVYILLIKYLLI